MRNKPVVITSFSVEINSNGCYVAILVNNPRSAHLMATERSAEKRFKLRYKDALLSSCCTERYASKFQFAHGKDQYERMQEEWEDNMDLWHSITYVYVYMFIILYPLPYTQDFMLNYKSLKSFKQF